MPRHAADGASAETSPQSVRLPPTFKHMIYHPYLFLHDRHPPRKVVVLSDLSRQRRDLFLRHRLPFAYRSLCFPLGENAGHNVPGKREYSGQQCRKYRLRHVPLTAQL